MAQPDFLGGATLPVFGHPRNYHYLPIWIAALHYIAKLV